jgi:uncharacterized protein
MLTVERLPTVDAYLEAAGSYLAAREAEHNVILGICANLQTGRRPPATGPVDYLVVRRDRAVILAAIRTPPHNLVLSEVDDGEALPLLAEALAPSDLPGVIGPTGASGGFAQDWCARAGRTPILELRERLFRLTVVRPPSSPPPGRLRVAGPVDGDLVMDWFVAFFREALPASHAPVLAERVERLIAEGGVFLWDDDGPASLAAVGARTPHGARIGPVYTPPERRRRGYASACVAGVSQALLLAGLRRVFLFTDLANPTANHIYSEIGFEPVRDVDSWRFGT